MVFAPAGPPPLRSGLTFGSAGTGWLPQTMEYRSSLYAPTVQPFISEGPPPPPSRGCLLEGWVAGQRDPDPIRVTQVKPGDSTYGMSDVTALTSRLSRSALFLLMSAVTPLTSSGQGCLRLGGVIPPCTQLFQPVISQLPNLRHHSTITRYGASGGLLARKR